MIYAFTGNAFFGKHCKAASANHLHQRRETKEDNKGSSKVTGVTGSDTFLATWEKICDFTEFCANALLLVSECRVYLNIYRILRCFTAACAGATTGTFYRTSSGPRRLDLPSMFSCFYLGF